MATREGPTLPLVGALKLQDGSVAQELVAETCAAEEMASSCASSIQRQVEALWDAVKWMEDRMEVIDAERRDELREASRAAAENTARVTM